LIVDGRERQRQRREEKRREERQLTDNGCQGEKGRTARKK
jgi:hypothetical protein